jgi:hypothetical protein
MASFQTVEKCPLLTERCCILGGLRVISEIVNESHALKLLSRQMDSTSKMMQNDGTLVLTAAYFGAFTSLYTFHILDAFKCET